MHFNLATLNQTGGRYCALLLIFYKKLVEGNIQAIVRWRKRTVRFLWNIPLIKLPWNKRISDIIFYISLLVKQVLRFIRLFVFNFGTIRVL